jgi:hypothetical protein
MKPSYVLSTATTRTNGPPVNSTYPAGCFMEDYIYTSGSGDLDDRNGRFCVTPEYPAGTYAYFATIDAPFTPAFPYTFYKTYYGVVQSGNIGPSGGHNTISEPVVTYNPNGIHEIKSEINFSLYPNPAADHLSYFIESYTENNMKAALINELGETVYSQDFIQPSVSYTADISKLPAGIYFLKLSNQTSFTTSKVMISH